MLINSSIIASSDFDPNHVDIVISLFSELDRRLLVDRSKIEVMMNIINDTYKINVSQHLVSIVYDYYSNFITKNLKMVQLLIVIKGQNQLIQ